MEIALGKMAEEKASMVFSCPGHAERARQRNPSAPEVASMMDANIIDGNQHLAEMLATFLFVDHPPFNLFAVETPEMWDFG